jgi:ribosomal protein L22
MSAEDETTGPAPQDLGGETPQEPTAGETGKAARKPVRARKAAKARAGEPAADAGEQADAVAGEGKPARAAAKKPAGAKKPAAKKPAARGKAPAAKAAAAEPAAEEKAEPKAAPRRAAAAGKPAPRRKVVRARARYVRTSARKARMVCGHLRGKSVQEARAILAFTPREVARDWSKLLESAVANAESNHELLEDDLIVREAYADEGPTIKRFRPRAMGRATPIRKRTSHLTITLTPGPERPTTKRHG